MSLSAPRCVSFCATAGRRADDPEKGCGIVVLALGKHGAGELNYSSDTDLIVLFDPDALGDAA